MRLYTNPKGEWTGTQADARKLGSFLEVDVPTSKADLLKFLNEHRVYDTIYNALDCDAPSAPVAEPSAPPVKSIATHRESAWHNINRVAEEAPLSELTTAMNIIMHRIQEHLEEGVR
tara:strand:+ start:3360 stop:3710 length:351 start_codon:yes stop_codon:yes gene_type:complete